MGTSDEAWLAAARARFAREGDWDVSPVPVTASVPPTPPAGPSCPYCPGHPPLSVFVRHEVGSRQPLRYCPQCYGFWARGDALAFGVADAADDHPALTAVSFPPRCRACGGHLKPDERCAGCGTKAAPLACPDCGREMQRVRQRGVVLDACGKCGGLWFDTGELGEAFGLEPPRSLASSLVGDDPGPSDSDLLLAAAAIAARALLPFL
ncbi:MAG: zf-TFIIB domain-containing protein [Dehalococcoidia bacterium]|nr:zf-TFIIB domain-containing protein [Dehalococcoidia bacterium]